MHFRGYGCMNKTTCEINKSQNSSGGQPEFIRLPNRGHDPIFGLCRTTWYDLEKQGLVRFRRLRTAGAIRGIVLIPVEETRDRLNKALEAAQ